MSARPVKSLEEQVADPLPAGIAALSIDDRTELARILVHARRTQARALEEAAYGLLDFVPRLLRGPVKKAAGL